MCHRSPYNIIHINYRRFFVSLYFAVNVYESSGFMDALTPSYTPAVPSKRKRKSSTTQKGATSPPTSPPGKGVPAVPSVSKSRKAELRRVAIAQGNHVFLCSFPREEKQREKYVLGNLLPTWEQFLDFIKKSGI